MMERKASLYYRKLLTLLRNLVMAKCAMGELMIRHQLTQHVNFGFFQRRDQILR